MAIVPRESAPEGFLEEVVTGLLKMEVKPGWREQGIEMESPEKEKQGLAL